MKTKNITWYELIPQDGHKSFYAKARVAVEEDGTKTLYSYNTPVVKIKDCEIIRLWNGWSATTGRHIKAFCGLNKASYDRLALEEA